MEKIREIVLTEREEEILLAYAANNMSRRKTASAIYRSLGTVAYHLTNIYERTGLDPRNFYDLVKLLYIVSSEEHVWNEEEAC